MDLGRHEKSPKSPLDFRPIQTYPNLTTLPGAFFSMPYASGGL